MFYETWITGSCQEKNKKKKILIVCNFRYWLIDCNEMPSIIVLVETSMTSLSVTKAQIRLPVAFIINRSEVVVLVLFGLCVALWLLAVGLIVFCLSFFSVFLFLSM